MSHKLPPHMNRKLYQNNLSRDSDLRSGKGETTHLERGREVGSIYTASCHLKGTHIGADVCFHGALLDMR